MQGCTREMHKDTCDAWAPTRWRSTGANWLSQCMAIVIGSLHTASVTSKQKGSMYGASMPAGLCQASLPVHLLIHPVQAYAQRWGLLVSQPWIWPLFLLPLRACTSFHDQTSKYHTSLPEVTFLSKILCSGCSRAHH